MSLLEARDAGILHPGAIRVHRPRRSGRKIMILINYQVKHRLKFIGTLLFELQFKNF
ncbi:MAG: hypothetical protein HKP41_04200 [Desulfobacterales bacterium]|nr:hypothetical protein [Desulfobacterales bacterium]